ncbi:MAG: gephyrin-like molybdotransferase Glp [Verrucomicrobiales bacterium]
MIDEDSARAQVLAAVRAGTTVSVGLAEAVGRWAAERVVATVALPGFDNSAMDGYAVHSEDCGQTDRWLSLAGEMAAGRAPVGDGLGWPEVRPGQAVRIFTGAPLPRGAAAVVMQEDVEVVADGSIRVGEAATPGDFIRRAGADVSVGQKLIERCDRLTPGRIGLLASQGRTSVAVTIRPRVLVITTGDEVVAAGEPLPHAGSIYNSNGPMLAALASQSGAIVDCRHGRDDPATLAAVVADGLESHDFLLIAGGVSVGQYDAVKPALEALGWRPDLWRVAVKPGKPFLFADCGGRGVFGVPGNPVSGFVTYHLFVAPALRKWQGAPEIEWLPPTAPGTLASAIGNPGDRPHYVRGVLDAKGGFRSAGLQESHALLSLSRSNALLRVPPGAQWEAGRAVMIHPVH